MVDEGAETRFARAQLALGAPQLRDVLHDAELPHRTAGVVPCHIALAVHHAHRCVGPNNAVLDVVARTAAKCDLTRFGRLLAIVRMDQTHPALLPVRKIDGSHAEDPARLVGKRYAAASRNHAPTSRRAQDLARSPGVPHSAGGRAARRARAPRRRSRRPISWKRRTSSSAPGPRVRALANGKHEDPIRLLDLRFDRHRERGLHAKDRQKARELRRHRSENPLHGAARRLELSAHCAESLVGRVLHSSRNIQLEARTLGLGEQYEGPRVRFAGMTAEHRAIALEDRLDGLEHVLHHILQIARALYRAVDPVQALEEPQVLPVFVFRTLALGDVPPDTAVADEVPGVIEHRNSGHRDIALGAVGVGRASSKSRNGRCASSISRCLRHASSPGSRYGTSQRVLPISDPDGGAAASLSEYS